MIGAKDGSGQPAVEKPYTMYFCAPATKRADEIRVKAIAEVHSRYRWMAEKH